MHRISKLLSRSLFRSAPHACLQLYYSQDYPSLIKKLAALSHTDYLAIRDPSFQHSLLDLAIIQNNSELIAAMASELPYFSKIVNNKDNEVISLPLSPRKACLRCSSRPEMEIYQSCVCCTLVAPFSLNKNQTTP